MVLPSTKRLEYVVDMKRIILRKLKLGVADGQLIADGKVIYTATEMKVGLFETGASPAGAG
jgi:3-hydroxyacyl-[acyl-carrier protein] dehydratase/trans-2-decenoyl-[acyl-carrier protein] isomerase